jgi:hypothetical protein
MTMQHATRNAERPAVVGLKQRQPATLPVVTIVAASGCADIVSAQGSAPWPHGLVAVRDRAALRCRQRHEFEAGETGNGIGEKIPSVGHHCAAAERRHSVGRSI